MKFFKYIFITCIGIISFLSGYELDYSFKNDNAQQFVQDMGKGWNLGNSLDPIDCYWTQDEMEYEVSWENPRVTKELISYIKSQGFDTIRIPVSWKNHLSEDGTISKNWMHRVKEVVNYAKDEGFYIIINVHHDEEWLKNASVDYNSTMEKYKKIWSQIAEEFGDYDEKLVFESLNELKFDDVSTEEGCKIISKINQEFTDLIRNSGKNNHNRYLLIAGYYTDIDYSIKEEFVLPEDSKVILSLHYYYPKTFAVARSDSDWGYDYTWGTEEDLKFLKSQFEKIKANFLDKGIPVIMSEYGVILDGKDSNSRALWFEKVTEECLNYGIAPIIWDNGEIIDRNNLSWKDEKLYSAIIKSE